MRRKRVMSLCECGVLLAMSVTLSLITVWRAPMGGSVTLLSMLPLLTVGVLHGYRWGLGTAFVYSLIQLAAAVASGNVFAYCYTPTATAVCAAFDYIVPFTLMGLSAATRVRDMNERRLRVRFIAVTAVLVTLRFVCHLVTGVVIWGQWAPEGMGKLVYSLIYNGTFMLPELILTVVGAAVLTGSRQLMRLLCR